MTMHRPILVWPVYAIVTFGAVCMIWQIRINAVESAKRATLIQERIADEHRQTRQLIRQMEEARNAAATRP